MPKTAFVFIFALAMLLPRQPVSAGKPAYQLFTAEGQKVTYADLLAIAGGSDIVLFGELHNNPIAHWLQFELSRDLIDKLENKLVMGAEMFEADDQIVLDEYLNGHILERHFLAEAKLWNNYSTDYRPLVELARENTLGFVATNIPRRYAALVHREGLEALENLDPLAQSYIAPLPIPYDPELPGYKAMLEMGGMPAHASAKLPMAQAIKDATMAHFLLQNLPGEGAFIHFHGTYHSNNYEGIVWYLTQYAETPLNILTIATVEQGEVYKLDESHLGLADFILAVPSSMTKTY